MSKEKLGASLAATGLVAGAFLTPTFAEARQETTPPYEEGSLIDARFKKVKCNVGRVAFDHFDYIPGTSSNSGDQSPNVAAIKTRIKLFNETPGDASFMVISKARDLYGTKIPAREPYNVKADSSKKVKTYQVVALKNGETKVVVKAKENGR